MDRQTGQGKTSRDYLALARRHLLLIIAIPVVAAIGAYFYAHSQTPMYSATAQIVYQPAIDPSNPSAAQALIDPSSQQLQVESATTMITGPAVAKLVGSNEGVSADTPSFSMSATPTSPVSSGGGATYTNGVAISVSSADPEWAAKLANAFATRFISWRADSQRTALTNAADAVQAQLSQFTTPDQKASSEYAILRERYQDLQVRAATATGDFTVVVPASAPSTPYAPKPKRSAVLAFAVGFIVALGAAFLRDRLDTKLRTSREVSDLLELPVVGRVPTISDSILSRGQLVVLDDRDWRAADAFRLLQTNLEFASMGDYHRALMITSAVQGEGKSLAIANLAMSLSRSGKSVLLIDADLRRPQIHRIFDLPNALGVSSVIAGKSSVEDALQDYGPASAARGTTIVRTVARAEASKHEAAAQLGILTAGPAPPNPGEMVASQRFVQLLERAKSLPFDYVLFDAPAFLPVGDASAVALGVDAVVVLVNLQVARRPVLEEFHSRLALLPVTKLGVIVVAEKIGEERHYGYHDSHSRSDRSPVPGPAGGSARETSPGSVTVKR